MGAPALYCVPTYTHRPACSAADLTCYTFCDKSQKAAGKAVPESAPGCVVPQMHARKLRAACHSLAVSILNASFEYSHADSAGRKPDQAAEELLCALAGAGLLPADLVRLVSLPRDCRHWQPRLAKCGPRKHEGTK